MILTCSLHTLALEQIFQACPTGLDKHKSQRKIVNILLAIMFYSDFIWDFRKLPFPEHLGKF